ncbi:hypothetical protein GYH30_023505 [Glycine max]|uniref:Uncharacterized protein n=1 Tax=Glycine max TaxID=3847 RepID=K7LAW6_SOYBN|nr:hypothetical protein GYH30_023505 [Glycine max]
MINYKKWGETLHSKNRILYLINIVCVGEWPIKGACPIPTLIQKANASKKPSLSPISRHLIFLLNFFCLARKVRKFHHSSEKQLCSTQF